MKPDLVISPKPSSRFRPFLLLLLFLACLILLAEGAYYWLKVKKSPFQRTYQSAKMEATRNIDVYLSPDAEERTGYFISGQRFTPTGRKQDDWIEIVTVGDAVLWIQKDSHYEPVKL